MKESHGVKLSYPRFDGHLNGATIPEEVPHATSETVRPGVQAGGGPTPGLGQVGKFESDPNFDGTGKQLQVSSNRGDGA